MSVEQIASTLLQLPREERRRFADWFYLHEAEIVAPQDDDEIHPEVRAELERRLKDIEEHPELLQPWDGTTDRIRAPGRNDGRGIIGSGIKKTFASFP